MKEICTSANIPTAKYANFNDLVSAKKYIAEQGAPIVIKADGLAAGKGVTVAMDLPTAYQAVEDIFNSGSHKLESKVVIEEFMEGEEASFFVLCNGQKLLPIGTALPFNIVSPMSHIFLHVCACCKLLYLCAFNLLVNKPSAYSSESFLNMSTSSSDHTFFKCK